MAYWFTICATGGYILVSGEPTAKVFSVVFVCCCCYCSFRPGAYRFSVWKHMLTLGRNTYLLSSPQHVSREQRHGRKGYSAMLTDLKMFDGRHSICLRHTTYSYPIIYVALSYLLLCSVYSYRVLPVQSISPLFGEARRVYSNKHQIYRYQRKRGMYHRWCLVSGKDFFCKPNMDLIFTDTIVAIVFRPACAVFVPTIIGDFRARTVRTGNGTGLGHRKINRVRRLL